jgi:Probable zinc-ribbon domain
MEYHDKILTCVDCKAEFIFPAGEQKFFADKGFTEPKRCKSCRARASERRAANRPPNISTLEGANR